MSDRYRAEKEIHGEFTVRRDNKGIEELNYYYAAKVILMRCKFKCTKCGKWKPASRFGLRTLYNADDSLMEIRNQPQCYDCRGGRNAD